MYDTNDTLDNIDNQSHKFCLCPKAFTAACIHFCSDMKIVVVEDHLDLREELVYFLNKRGHSSVGVSNGIELEQSMTREKPELVLLDIGLPGEDGISLAKRLSQHSSVSIVMLTARSGSEDRVQSYEAGADTYLVKPVNYRELEAVVERAAMRLRTVNENIDSCWQLNPRERVMAAPNGIKVPLTMTETRLLTSMMSRDDKVASRQQLVEALGVDFLAFDDRRIEVGISRLRKKVQETTGIALPVKACRNQGYSFNAPCFLRGS
jgi:DNA-binding response OmpR family regulator